MMQWRSAIERLVTFEGAVEVVVGLARVRGGGEVMVGEPEARRSGKMRDRVSRR